jgi:hypothetical protein
VWQICLPALAAYWGRCIWRVANPVRQLTLQRRR